MSEVIIIGAGGHAAEIDEYIKYSNNTLRKKKLSVAAFLDDNPENYARYNFSAPLMGSVKGHNVLTTCFYIISIADVLIRKSIVNSFREKGARFITFVDARAYVSESASLGEGCIIGPFANIGPNVKLGMFNLVNSRASLAHDSIIGNFNIISPNVCFSGFSSVGDENFFGINCASLPGISIGNRNKVAAGIIIDKNIDDDSTVFHRFKEKVIAVPKLLR